MFKKSAVIAATLTTLMVAAPAFAQTMGSSSASTTKMVSTANIASKIACVGTAVNARETALDAAVATHAQAVQAAYTARAAALSQAYTGSTAVGVRTSVKAAWSTFNASVKSAAQAWKTSQKSAWSTFKTAAKMCKVPGDVSDMGHSSSEMGGE